MVAGRILKLVVNCWPEKKTSVGRSSKIMILEWTSVWMGKLVTNAVTNLSCVYSGNGKVIYEIRSIVYEREFKHPYCCHLWYVCTLFSRVMCSTMHVTVATCWHTLSIVTSLITGIDRADLRCYTGDMSLMWDTYMQTSYRSWKVVPHCTW